MAVALLSLLGGTAGILAVVAVRFQMARSKRAAQQSIQRQSESENERLKQQALQQLTRTIVHDFGNMIAAMGMSLSLARIKLERQHASLSDTLADAETACERATRLAKQLVLLTRGEGGGGRRVASPLEVLDIVAATATKSGAAPVEVRTDPDLAPVECDEVQLALLVYALVMTAVQRNTDGKTVPVVADNWQDPSSQHHWCRIRVEHGPGQPNPAPTFDLARAEHLLVAHRAKLMREQTGERQQLTLLLPRAHSVS